MWHESFANRGENRINVCAFHHFIPKYFDNIEDTLHSYMIRVNVYIYNLISDIKAYSYRFRLYPHGMLFGYNKNKKYCSVVIDYPRVQLVRTCGKSRPFNKSTLFKTYLWLMEMVENSCEKISGYAILKSLELLSINKH